MMAESIPTMEPPLCPDSATMNLPVPDTSLNAHITWAFVVTMAWAFASAIALWRWQTRRRRGSTKQIQSSAKLEAKAEFLARVGSSYGYARSKRGFIDDWRASEFPTLIPPLELQTKGQRDEESSEATEPEVYLDYAGSAIPTRSLLSRISETEQVLANPHSLGGGLASDRTLKLMQLAKDRVMQHFGVQHEVFGVDELDRDEGNVYGNVGRDGPPTIPCPGYRMVFTSGATESLRLLAERFPWSSAKITSEQNYLQLGNDCTRQSTITESPAFSTKQLRSIRAQSILLYPRNVHTSVIGMREVAMQRGGQFHCVPIDQLLNATCDWFRSLVKDSISCECEKMKARDAENMCEEKKDDNIALQMHEPSDAGAEESTRCKTIWMHHLLVLPLECNFGGDRFDWSSTIAMARKSAFSSHIHCGQSTSVRICHKWHILLDIAKAAATSPVNLPTLTPAGGPDFAVLSFYKMFGAPTGLGCLIVKKNRRRNRERNTDVGERDTPATRSVSDGGVMIERIRSQRQFFGGGSVDVVLPERDFVVPRNGMRAPLAASGPAGNALSDEDESIDLGAMVHGTEHFRGIVSIAHGFQEIEDLGGMKAISSHCDCLASELVARLRRVVHDNGKHVVEMYGQWKSLSKDTLERYPSNESQPLPGPIVVFNVCDRDGSKIGYDEVARLASLNRPPIQLRTGCFCNPGACQDALSLSNSDVLDNYNSGHVCGDRRGIVNGRPTGAIRASFGKDSTWEDMDGLATFIEKVFASNGETLVSSSTLVDPECETRDAMRIERLFVFPIKSCAAMRVTTWPIDRKTGRLAFDREFALVDTSGSAMRLHSYPVMSSIHSTIDLSTHTLIVTSPNHEDLIINLEEPSADCRTKSPEDIQVCGALCKGNIWGGSNASRWFSSVLGVRCWLARHYNAGRAERLSNGDQYAYCNEASLLLVSQQSISFLNSVIASQGFGKLVDSRHFRPNIVVASDCQEDSAASKAEEIQRVVNPEDSWQQITIRGSTGAVELTAVGKCARCQMVDIDPTSGMKGNTLRALAQYRRDRGRINFGTFFTGSADASEETAWLEEGSDVQASVNTSKATA